MYRCAGAVGAAKAGRRDLVGASGGGLSRARGGDESGQVETRLEGR